MGKFNLNEMNDGGVTVFNGGTAGKVENVTINVEKRKADEPDTYPDYKLVVTDGSGATPLTMGFKREVADENHQTQNIQRIKSIAKSVVPNNFVYPEVDSYEEAVDALFKVIKENADGKKVNVFTTYGYTGKPSKYLGLRYFNFIEGQDEAFSRLKPSPSDVMERPMEDAPAQNSEKKEVSWND